MSVFPSSPLLLCYDLIIEGEALIIAGCAFIITEGSLAFNPLPCSLIIIKGSLAFYYY